MKAFLANKSLIEEFDFALRWSRRIFENLTEDALYMRPITLRYPCIFYFGHLPAFSWNQIFRSHFKRDSFNPIFDQLFERGIDPHDLHGETANARAWPKRTEVESYGRRVEAELKDLVHERHLEADRDSDLLRILNIVLEHYLMHIETFLYMQHQLENQCKSPLPEYRPELSYNAPVQQMVFVPAGTVRLGMPRGRFGWCNEFDSLALPVEAFVIDKYPVTNGSFLEFVNDGGYRNRSLWSADSWFWIQHQQIDCPKNWIRDGQSWTLKALFGYLPLPEAWPAWVSYAEAEAYVRWKGAALLTEAEFHRAAYGCDEVEWQYPWGNEPPDNSRGNFGLRTLTPAPVGSFPNGATPLGVQELVGNGWEWTSSKFSPFPGFRPLPSYPGYSADFFDGRHFVLKGASPLTADRLIRRSFRNWFQPHYPYVYAKFRCVYRN